MSTDVSNNENQELSEERPIILQLLAKKLKSYRTSDEEMEISFETGERKQSSPINTNADTANPTLSIKVNVDGIEDVKISSVTLDSDNSLTLTLSLESRRH